MLKDPQTLTPGQVPVQTGAETPKAGSVQPSSTPQPAVQPEGSSAVPDSPEAAAPSESPITPSPIPSSQSSEQTAPEAIKVGQYQSQERTQEAVASPTVATIQPHLLQGRQAATLYVRNIPVLTFLGAVAEATGASDIEVKVASVQDSAKTAVPAKADEAQPAASQPAPAGTAQPISPAPSVNSAVSPAPVVNQADSRDPVWRATTTAARLNQLHRDSVSADEIKIAWNADRQRYVITAGGVEVIALDADTVLPDTVESSAGDLLQVANRIRRQMGNATPLSTIEGDPNGFNQVSLGPVSLRISGYASWYGPGFDGNYSASGEVFNQNALT
ncbi:MAG: hypothetical protein ACKO7W_19210, partial [Elainella sp.]